MRDADDHELVRHAQAGDRASLEQLLRRHHDRIWAIARRIVGNDADAADATQEALLAVVRGLPRFDGRSAFTTWMYRVVTNTCLDELRRRNRRPRPVETFPEASHVDPDPVEHMVIDAALAELSPEFRAAVVLRDVAGLDYAAIAEVLNIPPGTVRSRIARGRAALAVALTGNLGDDEQRQSIKP
ncbi:MAG: putative polymerase subfamily sigma factor [Acidimicrobiia bacterium]|nr:putative polymerase subfamily sigma factor [Acidimicrobiia bacterium]